jgi:hypothetical protein
LTPECALDILPMGKLKRQVARSFQRSAFSNQLYTRQVAS